MDKLLEKIELYLIYALVILFPVAVASISPNPFIVIKSSVLVYGICAILLVKAIRVIVSGKLEFSVSYFDFPVFVIAVAYILSTALRTPNKMEALLLPGTTTLIVGASVLYFLVNQLNKKAKENVTLALVVSGGIYAVFMLFSALGLFERIPQLPAFMRVNTFSPDGGYIPSAIFLATLVPMGAGLILSQKNVQIKTAIGASLALIIAGLGISIYSILPGRPTAPRFPDLNTSWFIAVDTLKESPLLGVGPGNYLTSFNRFRPITFNSTDLWPLKFSTANNLYLTSLTETGLIGAAGFILLLLSVYRLVKKDFKEKKLVSWGFAGSANLISLVLVILLLALFPSTQLPVLVLFILLSINATSHKSSVNLTSQVSVGEGYAAKAQGIASRLPAIILTLPVLAVVAYVGFNAFNYLKAENKFRSAIVLLAQNEGIASYDMMREAININPSVDRYHASYSQVNLALANAIASNENITDQDRTNIAQLVQQAIREGKATVALNPLRAGNWEILARTYQTIIPLATGADVFSAHSYAQAVALDPINPNLRVSLGGLYYAAGNYDTAIRVFELASSTKPDLANPHFNLAFALKEAGQLDRAISEMTLVLSLVDRSSNDYEIARQALEDMQSKKEADTTASGTETLTPPQELPQPVITPPIELPEDSEPPETPITPTPTPQSEDESNTPTPQITPVPTIIP